MFLVQKKVQMLWLQVQMVLEALLWLQVQMVLEL
jgi:hypothetical protein